MKASEFVVKRLHQWGVRRIFVYLGDGINGVIGALQHAGNIECAGSVRSRPLRIAEENVHLEWPAVDVDFGRPQRVVVTPFYAYGTPPDPLRARRFRALFQGDCPRYTRTAPARGIA